MLREKRIIGFARAYSDGAFSAMISDVAIESAYEHNEVGRKMILTLIERLRAEGIGSFATMASRGTHDYFHTCGFRETYLRALSFKGNNLNSINVGCDTAPGSLQSFYNNTEKVDNSVVAPAATVSAHGDGCERGDKEQRFGKTVAPASKPCTVSASTGSRM